jgi:hypothetical protein
MSAVRSFNLEHGDQLMLDRNIRFIAKLPIARSIGTPQDKLIALNYALRSRLFQAVLIHAHWPGYDDKLLRQFVDATRHAGLRAIVYYDMWPLTLTTDTSLDRDYWMRMLEMLGSVPDDLADEVAVDLEPYPQDRDLRRLIRDKSPEDYARVVELAREMNEWRKAQGLRLNLAGPCTSSHPHSIYHAIGEFADVNHTENTYYYWSPGMPPAIAQPFSAACFMVGPAGAMDKYPPWPPAALYERRPWTLWDRVKTVILYGGGTPWTAFQAVAQYAAANSTGTTAGD